MKYYRLIILALIVLGCANKKKYDPTSLYDKAKLDWMLSRIIAHIYTAPTYVKMSDRLKPEHQDFYLSQTFRFTFLQLTVDEKGRHYFLVERPAPGQDKRVVGGYFTIGDKDLEDFREVFVTPQLPHDQLIERSQFLFKKMVEGKLDDYLKMRSYVEWPNEISYYDSISYEWKSKSVQAESDSISNK